MEPVVGHLVGGDVGLPRAVGLPLAQVVEVASVEPKHVVAQPAPPLAPQPLPTTHTGDAQTPVLCIADRLGITQGQRNRLIALMNSDDFDDAMTNALQETMMRMSNKRFRRQFFESLAEHVGLDVSDMTVSQSKIEFILWTFEDDGDDDISTLPDAVTGMIAQLHI